MGTSTGQLIYLSVLCEDERGHGLPCVMFFVRAN